MKKELTTAEFKEIVQSLRARAVPLGTPLSEIILPKGMMLEDEIDWLTKKMGKIRQSIPMMERVDDPIIDICGGAVIGIGIMMLQVYDKRLKELQSDS